MYEITNLCKIISTGKSGADFIHRLTPSPDGLSLKVLYIPTEVGEGSIRLDWDGYHITGAPFKPKIVAPQLIKVVEGVPESVLRATEEALEEERTGSLKFRQFDTFEWCLPLKEMHMIVFEAIDAGPGTPFCSVNYIT